MRFDQVYYSYLVAKKEIRGEFFLKVRPHPDQATGNRAFRLPVRGQRAAAVSHCNERRDPSHFPRGKSKRKAARMEQGSSEEDMQGSDDSNDSDW